LIFLKNIGDTAKSGSNGEDKISPGGAKDYSWGIDPI
jgi:hypothetical protein